MITEYPFLKIKNVEDGKGLFASEDIPAGMVLLKIEGKEPEFAETEALGENESSVCK